ncbi:MAG: non-hydrolyzing UDP-N-acetylglucosamine 2-epimerase [Solirubrobacteraceae bacterium]
MGTQAAARRRTHGAARRRVMVCFGTRPEVIKLAPVIRALRSSRALEAYTVTTAQHREMLDQALQSFMLTIDEDLDLMRPRQGLAQLTSVAVSALAEVLQRAAPDVLIVQGDTTTAMCAALAGFYAGVPVGHVEAGLRSGDRRAPFPEEVNRRIVSQLASWHFCPTAGAAENLRAEQHDPGAVLFTGNTIVDALQFILGEALATPVTMPAPGVRRILVTLHRRETQGERQRELCRMLARVASELEAVEILFPVHLSPSVRTVVMPELSRAANVALLEPLGYPEFIHVMASSHLIVTDSGGVQEEAPSLGVPVLVMRDTTERPEGILAGCARLSGTDPRAVERDIRALLSHPALHDQMTGSPNPYGDGQAAQRIVACLERDLSAGRTDELSPSVVSDLVAEAR